MAHYLELFNKIKETITIYHTLQIINKGQERLDKLRSTNTISIINQ